LVDCKARAVSPHVSSSREAAPVSSLPLSKQQIFCNTLGELSLARRCRLLFEPYLPAWADVGSLCVYCRNAPFADGNKVSASRVASQTLFVSCQTGIRRVLDASFGLDGRTSRVPSNVIYFIARSQGIFFRIVSSGYGLRYQLL
jgi:hypothetical protein